jgi:primosomal protein N''
MESVIIPPPASPPHCGSTAMSLKIVSPSNEAQDDRMEQTDSVIDNHPKGQAIEDHLNKMASIVTLLHETVEGDRLLCVRSYLVDEMTANLRALKKLLGHV